MEYRLKSTGRQPVKVPQGAYTDLNMARAVAMRSLSTSRYGAVMVTAVLKDGTTELKGIVAYLDDMCRVTAWYVRKDERLVFDNILQPDGKRKRKSF